MNAAGFGTGLFVGCALALTIAGALTVTVREERAGIGADCPYGFARIGPTQQGRCISEQTADWIAEDCYTNDHGHDTVPPECGETPTQHRRHGNKGGGCILEAGR
jgi:hypothetical protein